MTTPEPTIRPDAELYVLLRKAGVDRHDAQALIDAHAEQARAVRAASGVQPDTREHHTVDGVRHLCHTGDHYCPAPARPECAKCALPDPRHSAACPNRPTPQHVGEGIQGSGYTPAQLLGADAPARPVPDTGFVPSTCIVCSHASHTEVCHCGCEATVITDWRVVPDTERRERYAAAIGATDIHNAHVIRLAVDAVMAVADEEGAELQTMVGNCLRLVEKRDKENRCLRARAEAAEAKLQHMREEETREVHRLRAELALARAAVAELGQAIRLTREYVGEELLPAVEGWSWYDALSRHAPAELTAAPGGQAEDGAQQK